jgi:hypothetical protein
MVAEAGEALEVRGFAPKGSGSSVLDEASATVTCSSAFANLFIGQTVDRLLPIDGMWAFRVYVNHFACGTSFQA